MSQNTDETRHTTESIDETPDGYPICQWCGGAITHKDDLVVAAEETGVPTRIAPVGYTAPRSFTAFHRDCHAEATDEPLEVAAPTAATFWTPVNVGILALTALVILIVLYVAIFAQ